MAPSAKVRTAAHGVTSTQVKPEHGQCADGFDLYVDFTTRFALFKVTDNADFKVAERRSNDNAALDVTLEHNLMPDATDAKPQSAPPKNTKKKKRRRLNPEL